jgi:uncharacterized protein YaiI (UPF0178 family)
MAARRHYISDEQRDAAEVEIVDRSRRIDFYTTDDVPLNFHPAATRVLGLVTPRSVG